MEPKATIESAEVLLRLMKLSTGERHWVLGEFLKSLDNSERNEAFEFVTSIVGNSEQRPSVFESARERLLDDPSLSAGEKVLLVALMLRELYEIEDFNSRQITENLRELETPVNNVTAALNGLIAKNEVTIATSDQKSGKNAHKRYRLTSEGTASALSLTRSRSRIS